VALTAAVTGFWELEEASGNRSDASSSGNTLTDNNTVTSNAGKVGTCGHFTAANSEWLSHTNTASLQTGGAFSLQAWVYWVDSSANQVVIGRWSGAGTYEYLLYYDAGAARFKFFVTSDGQVATAASVTASTFGAPSQSTFYLVHAGLDVTNSQIWISVNAGTRDTASYSAAMASTTSTFAVGRNDDAGGGSYWNGFLDQVGFWKGYSLTTAECTTLYNGGSGMTWAAMVAADGGGAATRGIPFDSRGTAFNGGRTFTGILRRTLGRDTWQRRRPNSLLWEMTPTFGSGFAR
jgi:hypothetical protein